MVQVWRLGDNFVHLKHFQRWQIWKKNIALMKKCQSFSYPTLHAKLSFIQVFFFTSLQGHWHPLLVSEVNGTPSFKSGLNWSMSRSFSNHPWPLWVKIYAVKNFEMFSTYSHTYFRLDPMVKVFKKDFFSITLLWFT
jgi:hypothetical protein